MSKVVDSTEKGKRVFKKPQENREEEKYFYNAKYFEDIGFPETKVYEGEMTEDGVMKGGYYNYPDQLTDPFRRFVKIIQREKQLKYEDEDEDESYLNPVVSVEDVKYNTVEDQPKNETPWFFDRIGEYGNYVKTSADKLSPYFKINRVEVENPTNVTQLEPQLKQESESKIESETESKIESETESKIESETESKIESEPESKIESETVNKKYWVVKIPILKDDEFTPKGKYEKAEAKMNQILREEKVDKKIGKSKIGNMYDVGSKYVRICEEVKDWERYEIDNIKLPGSKMEKIIKSR